MNNFLRPIIPNIKANYDRFTASEKVIADFFLTNRERVDFSAKALAERLYLSEATLSKFAKKCGYRGYKELIYQYEKTFVEKKEAASEKSRIALETYQELLNRTYNLMDEEQVNRICRDLGNAQRVFVCGKGSSGLAAREMELRFMRIGVDITSIQDSDLIRMQSVFQKSDNIVIGISISGEREEVLYLLKEAHRQKSRTILITANRQDLFREYCDEIVLVPSLRFLNRGNLISPQFPILLMLDIIYSTYVENDKRNKQILHENTLKALNGDRNLSTAAKQTGHRVKHPTAADKLTNTLYEENYDENL